MSAPSRGGRPRRILRRLRQALTAATAALFLVSLWGLAVPAPVRCSAPAAVGCPGGWLGPSAAVSPTDLTQWFDITAYDYGFWIVNSASGVNESSQWTVLEGYTVHINATSLAPDASKGGTSAHGVGVLGDGINFQLYTTIGGWVNTSFPVPYQAATGLEVYCVNNCGSGHSGMHENILDVVPAESAPVPSVTTGRTSGPYPLQVNFSATAVNGTPPYRFDWNFGDGTTGTGAAVSHLYLQVGHFRSTLTVFDANGVAGTASVLVVVTVPPGLNVTASATPTSGSAPLDVAFSSTVGNGTPPYTYTWIFGDGHVASVPSPTHVYTVPGEFTIDLAVQDSVGKSGSAYLRVNVTGPPSPLRLSIAIHPAAADLPTANVTGYASVIGGSPPFGPISWLWGDGSPGSIGDPASHVYAAHAPGSYAIIASLRDALGATATARANFSWYPPPNATLGAALSSPHAPSSVELWLNATGGNGTYSGVTWDYGDGTVAPGPLVVFHNYTSPGAYRVVVTCHDSTGVLLVAVTWVNLTAPGPGAGGRGLVGIVLSPFVPLTAFSAVGLLLLLLAARQERRATLGTGPPDPAPVMPPSPAAIAPSRRNRTERRRGLPGPVTLAALAALAACAAVYWSWSPNGPAPASQGLWSLIGAGVWAALEGTLLLGLARPLALRLRAIDRPPTAAGTILAAIALAAVWLLALRELVVTGGALPPSGAGLAVLPQHSPFGTWPSALVGGPGPIRLELVPPMWILIGTLAYLAAGASVLTAARPRPSPAATIRAPWWGTLAMCLPALGASNGCCSPPVWTLVLSTAGTGALGALYANAPDLVDGLLLFAAVGISVFLTVRALASETSG